MALKTMIEFDLKILDHRLNEYMPSYGSVGAAGIDLRACIWGEIELAPGETKLIPAGFSFYMADPKYAAMILPRSGMGFKEGLVIGNLVGLIDSDYQGPISIGAWNRNLEDSIRIQPMQRIAQMVIVPVIQAKFNIVEEFESKSVRGLGAYGSTGVN